MGHEADLPLEASGAVGAVEPFADHLKLDVGIAGGLNNRDGENFFLVEIFHDLVDAFDVESCRVFAAVGFDMVNNGRRGSKDTGAVLAFVDQSAMHRGPEMLHVCVSVHSVMK